LDVFAGALDPEQVAEAVARAKPDVIVHRPTAIGAINPRHFDRDFAPTNRLRIEGADHLLSAAQALRVRPLGLGWLPRHPSWRRGLAAA
jgi:hypothetical protein